jgi:hypothetical protein
VSATRGSAVPPPPLRPRSRLRVRNVTLIAAMLGVASACAAHRELAKREPAPSKGPNTPSASAVPLGTAATVPSAAVPAPSAAPAPATTSTQSAATAGTKTASSGVNQGLLKEGYRATKKRGQLMYCRTEVVTGTRFRNNVCLTEAQIMEQRRNARDTLNAPRKAQCVGGCGS